MSEFLEALRGTWVARDATVRSAPKVEIGCEGASKSSDDCGALPQHLHFVKRLSASHANQESCSFEAACSR